VWGLLDKRLLITGEIAVYTDMDRFGDCSDVR
jgi:hypothetical protein